VALNSRGNILRDKKNYNGAIESYSRAIQIRPDYAESLINRGYTWWTLKNFEAGIADVERGLALDPDYAFSRGELLHIRMYTADWHDFEQRKAELESLVRAGKQAVQPFIFQAIAESPADLQACSRIWGEKKYPPIADRPHVPALRRQARKIRIGYLSGEFRQQATAILMAGLYERHDRGQFEIVAVSAGVNDQSPMRARLEKAFDRWLDISRLPDQEACDVIRDSEIDILVNLNGYFGETRMGVFARRPAPLQVNYLGFPATLGMPYIDYILADRIVIPQDEQGFYDEQVVTLPDSYQANDDRGRAMAAMPSRSEVELPEKAFVFCNFNNAYKLTPSTFAGWMRILNQVEGSVLWLLESTAPYPDNLRREAEKHGVAAERLIFAPDLPTDQHLARLQLADLFLDSLPYNAHTTASDALWTGVPLLSCRGRTFPGRVATSLLLAAGLPELVTETTADFEAMAVRLAGDSKALKVLRDRLAQNKSTCALFDTNRFCRHIETAYRIMWDRWLAGDKPKGFAVPAAD
jgi:predicted O-linked N-acetylglucosamine transferase (SPINDLY family)